MRHALLFFSLLFLASCSKDVRIVEHPDWGKQFAAYGIDSACFILRDHAHERVHVYNRDRCTQRFLPASTFKIFLSLAAF